jgi:hypothetical protein
VPTLPRPLLSLSLCLLLAACGGPQAPATHALASLSSLFHPAAATLRMPVRIAPDVLVKRAQFGLLETTPDGEERFTPTTDVPAEDGQLFGWVLEIQTRRDSLHWQEHLQLPRPPVDWGDAADDPDILISKDGKSVVAQGEDAVEDGELSRFYWSLAPGDPGGDYELDVAVEGKTVASFRFHVPATVQEKPILVHREPPRIAHPVAMRAAADLPPGSPVPAVVG